MITVGATTPGRLRPHSPSITAPETSTPYIITGTPARPGTTITGSLSAAAGGAARAAPSMAANVARAILHCARINLSEKPFGQRATLGERRNAACNAAGKLRNRINLPVRHVARAVF